MKKEIKIELSLIKHPHKLNHINNINNNIESVSGNFINKWKNNDT